MNRAVQLHEPDGIMNRLATKLAKRQQPCALMEELVDYINQEANTPYNKGGMTMNAIANRAGVTPGMIKRWQSGQTRHPQAHSLRLVGEVLGLELSFRRK